MKIYCYTLFYFLDTVHTVIFQALHTFRLRTWFTNPIDLIVLGTGPLQKTLQIPPFKDCISCGYLMFSLANLNLDACGSTSWNPCSTFLPQTSDPIVPILK